MKNVINQFRFWVILGPLVMLLTFFAALVKVSTPYLLIPSVALVGLPLSWRGKLPGLALTLSLFAGTMAYYYPMFSVDERFWQVGLCMAFSIACVIIALCSEETEGLLDAVELESESRLDNLRLIDEKFKVAKKKAEKEVTDYQSKLDVVQNALEEKEGKINSQAEVIVILREELRSVYQRASESAPDEEIIKLTVVDEMSNHIENLTREKELLQNTLKRLQSELEQTTVSKE